MNSLTYSNCATHLINEMVKHLHFTKRAHSAFFWVAYLPHIIIISQSLLSLCSVRCTKQLSVSVNTIPIKEKVPSGVLINERIQVNYPIYVLGTKQRQESIKYLKVTLSFTIVCGFKHIHTHDSTCFLYIARQFKQAHEYLTHNRWRSTHIHTYSCFNLYKLRMHRLSTHKHS